jgi:hypothetical protein
VGGLVLAWVLAAADFLLEKIYFERRHMSNSEDEHEVMRDAGCVTDGMCRAKTVSDQAKV